MTFVSRGIVGTGPYVYIHQHPHPPVDSIPPDDWWAAHWEAHGVPARTFVVAAMDWRDTHSRGTSDRAILALMQTFFNTFKVVSKAEETAIPTDTWKQLIAPHF